MVFRLFPYLCILILVLLTNAPKVVRMDFYELDEEENRLLSL